MMRRESGSVRHQIQHRADLSRYYTGWSRPRSPLATVDRRVRLYRHSSQMVTPYVQWRGGFSAGAVSLGTRFGTKRSRSSCMASRLTRGQPSGVASAAKPPQRLLPNKLPAGDRKRGEAEHSSRRGIPRSAPQGTTEAMPKTTDTAASPDGTCAVRLFLPMVGPLAVW